MSLRLGLLNLLFRAVVKPRLRTAGDPVRARREFDLAARLLLAGARGTATRRVAAGPPVPPLTWFTPGGADPEAVVLYFHGGGYTAGSPTTHRGLVSRLAVRTGLSACVPAYRLAPEHPFPAAQEDALSAWRALVGQGVRPDRIALAGDSAGGGLALSLLSHLCRAGTPPFAAVAFSAWTDMTGSGASMRDNAASDPFLPAERMPDLVRFALNGHPPGDPSASPLFADFPGCPPVLLQVSACEILRDDSRRLAERLTREGAAAELQVWPGAPHAWPVFAGRIPEADAAVTAAAAFLRAQLAAQRAGASAPPERSAGS